MYSPFLSPSPYTYTTQLMNILIETLANKNKINEISKYKDQINIRTKDNYSSLDLCALYVNKYSSIEALNELLKYSNANDVDKYGDTTLHKVCYYIEKIHYEAFKILCNYTDVNILNGENKSALRILYNKDYKNLCDCCRCEKCTWEPDMCALDENCILKKHNLNLCTKNYSGNYKEIKYLLLNTNIDYNNKQNIDILIRVCNHEKKFKLYSKFMAKYFNKMNDDIKIYIKNFKLIKQIIKIVNDN